MKQIYYRYLLIILAVFLGALVLLTPRIVTNDSDLFSAERVLEDIETIALAPHTVEDDALEDVRTYLFNRLDELGLNPEYKTYPQTDPDYDMTEVTNIAGVLEGTNDSYILLVAHYDSAPGNTRIGQEPGSFGAADDAYGLASILEIINVIKTQNITLENGIKVLFTDAEEVGLYGAEQAALNDSSFFVDVAYVINVEARGVKGPAIMFETSVNNYNVIRLFKEAYMPVSFSLAGDVYQKMPNGTDFTPITGIGVQGINIAVLDNLDYYHTPNDNIDNINLRSIQHYGEQLYPIVKEFVSNPDYSDLSYLNNDQNAIYFTFLPDVFVVYSVTTQWILTIITLILLVVAIVLNYNDKLINLKKVFLSFGIFLLGSILLMILGVLISMLLGAIFGIPFSITYMPQITGSLYIFFIIMILELLLFMFIIKKFTKTSNSNNSIYFGSLLFNTLFMIILSFVLMGGSYLFTLPVLLASIVSIIVYLLSKSEIKNYRLISRILISQNIIWPIVLFTPILYLLYLALTIGALGVTMLFLTFPLTIAISSLYLVDYK